MALTMVLSDYGLSALASAPGGTYVAPVYLAIETTHATIQSTILAGATSVSLSQQVDQAGDTQLVLSVGLGTQEVVTFTGAPTNSGGNWIYTLSSPTTQTHNNGEIATRQPSNTDTVSNIVSEMQVDSVLLPGQRIQTVAGYPGSTGVFTVQFYMTGQQANGMLAILYLTDSVTIGQGNIHAYGVYGYDHSFPTGGSTNDLETDLVFTVARG